MARNSSRIYFLDELRGLALVGMIIYHTLYDLYEIFGLKFEFDSPTLNAFQLAICSTFIMIAGISSRLSHNIFKHGFIVFGAGLLMTAGTYIFMPELTIWFGILHFLGASMIIYALFKDSIDKAKPVISSIISLTVFLCLFGLPSGSILFGKADVPRELYFSKYLAVLGLPGEGFSSADYFPLLPWFFLFLAGCFIGKYFKERKVPNFMLKKHSKFLSLIGSHTLIIYIIHQPVIYAILTAFFWAVEKGSAL